MAKKTATRKPRAAKKATTAPAAETTATKTRGRQAGVNKSELVRKYAAEHKGAKAAEIQKALAEQGVTLSLPGIYQALRSKNGSAKKKKSVAIAAKAKASKNGRHHDEHGAVSRFIHSVGELGIEASESLFATIKKLTGRK